MTSVDEINKLKEKLEIRETFIEQLKEYNEKLKGQIRPFEDSYFNGLSPIEIAELAKTSIRLTCENRRLERALEKIKEYITPACEGAYNEEDFLKIKQIISECEGENEIHKRTCK